MDVYNFIVFQQYTAINEGLAAATAAAVVMFLLSLIFMPAPLCWCTKK